MMKYLPLLFAIIVIAGGCKKSNQDQALEAAVLNPVSLPFTPIIKPLVLADGNIILLGGNDSTLFMAKISPQGVPIWNRSYVDSVFYGFYSYDIDYTEINSITEDNEGFLYACGSLVSSNRVIAVFKISSSGDPIRIMTHAGGEFGDGREIVKMNSGHLLIGANARHGTALDFYLVKMDANGNHIWDQNLSSSGSDRMNGLIQTTDGSYIITGSKSPGLNKNYVVKVNSNGVVLWEKEFGVEDTFSINCVKETTAGDYIMCGYLANSTGRNGLLLKVAQDGSILWSQIFGAANNSEEAIDIIENNDGSFTAVGYGISTTTGNLDAMLMKVSSAGGKQLFTYFGSNSNATTVRITKESNGNNLIFGYLLDENRDTTSFFTTRTDANGNFIP